MAQNVTMQGKPLTLIGSDVKVEQKAPDFEVQDGNLKSVHLSSIKDKVVLILSVPSLDTSVCSLETKRFNQELAKLKNQVSCLTISMDLPFAQKRWCAQEGIENVQTLSDHFNADFGNKYGVLVKELRLLARAVFIVDDKGVIRYCHICKELTEEPPYTEVMAQVQQLLAGAK